MIELLHQGTGGDMIDNTNPNTINVQAKDSQSIKRHNKPLALT